MLKILYLYMTLATKNKIVSNPIKRKYFLINKLLENLVTK